MASKFPTVKLGKVARVRSGFAFRSNDWLYAGIPVVKMANIKDGRLAMSNCSFVSADVAANANFNLQENDILLSMTGAYLGDVAWVRQTDLPAVLNQRVGLFSILDGKLLDRRFLFYMLRSPETRMEIYSLGYGSAQPNVSPDLIHNIEIPLPVLREQRAIGVALGTLDDKIELNRRMNQTLETMARAIFKSWFVDFDSVLRENNLLRLGQPAKLPEGWRAEKLSSVASINEKTVSSDYAHENINYIDISSVSRGYLIETKLYRASEAPSRARNLVASGDTIWSCVRPNRRSYLYIYEPPENTVVSTGFAVLTPKKVPSTYLYYWVTTDSFVEYLESSADGSAYPAVRPSYFGEAGILVPPDDVLRHFQEIVGPMLEKVAINDAESRVLASIRDTLLPKLLSGEIRVKQAEKIVGEVV